MSLTLLRENSKKVISIFSISLFAILAFFFNVNHANATELNSCGEIAFGGEYILSTNIGTTSETCLVISASGVTINGTSTYSVLGNIVGNRTNYTLTDVVDTGDLSIFYYNNAAADGNWANRANWWLDSAYTLTANRSGITVPSTQDAVVIDGAVTQISTGVASVKSARFINNATWNVGSSITDGLVWTKLDNTTPANSDGASTNGRLPLGSTAGRGDLTHAYPTAIIKDGSTYKLWYQGSNGTNDRIFYATSANGLAWTKSDNTIPSASDTTSTNGRIALGTSGKGDEAGLGSPAVLKDGSTYKMWYGGKAADNVWRAYYATSPDGLTWTKYNNVTPTASDTVSTDGRIAAGTSGKGDSAYVLPRQVIKDGDLYKMWYRGYDGVAVRTYYATSPDGLTWTKYDNSVPASSDSVSTNGRVGLGTSGRGDDLHNNTPIIYKDGAMYKMFYAGYSSTAGNTYAGYYATSPDGLTWTKYNNVIPSLSDTTSTDGRIPRGNSGRSDSSGILPMAGILESGVFKIWYAAYNATNWRGSYATASNSYRSLNLSADSSGSVSFEDNSKFGKGTISTVDSNSVSEVNFTGTSIATEASIRAQTVNIDTSTSTVGVFEILNNDAVVNVDNLAESSTVNIVGSNAELNLNNSVVLSTASGNDLDLTLNDSSRVGAFGLTGNSSVTFNTTYYHGSTAPTGGTLVINNGGLAGVISSGTTLYDSDNNSVAEIEFRNSTTNSLKGITTHVSFHNTSSNTGIINANVTVNYPSAKPIGGTVTGTVSYEGYGGFVYNNTSGDGKWSNTSNWSTAALPTRYDDVDINGNLVMGYGRAQSYEMFSGTNEILVETTRGADFYNSSINSGFIVGTTTYHGDTSELTTSSTEKTFNLGSKSIDFSGSSQYITTSSINLNTSDYTMCFWFMADVNSVDQGMINMLADGTNRLISFGWFYNNVYFRLTSHYQGSTYIPTGQWTHVCGTRDYISSQSVLNLFINSTKDANFPVTQNNPSNVTGSLNIGRWPGGGYDFNGKMSEVAIWNRVLTQEEISDVYKSRAGSVFSGLIHYWNFNESSGSTANDVIGARNGTLVNNPTRLSTVPTRTFQNTSPLIRVYNSDITTNRNFTLNGGRWIIESDGADINLSGATYAVSTTTYQSDKNVFRAKNGATFTENSSINGGSHVVPKVVINSPTAGTNTRWSPNISWDDADTCQYKWGTNGTYTNVNCASGGSDIPRPTAFATTTLYVKGIYNDTSYSEQLTTFIYDNITPISTSCSTIMDESTREYYYLESDVTGDCTATANITLKGNVNPLLPGYTINGRIIANATSTTNGFNLVLSNINVTGEITANGSGSGKRGGSITLADSTTSNITTNGGAISVTNSVTSQLASNSNSGGILGGNITVNVSTTTDIYANGGDITVSTSSVGLANSTSPTTGIAGGDVSITVSTAGDVTTNGGDVTITDSTISAINADGISGIANAGAVTVTNSTLTSISANGTGSGSRGGHVTVLNSNPTSIATNGGNISITNVTTGDINASGNSGGISAGTISIELSTTTAIYANGGTNTSGNGGNGATITIATSTTGLIEASGADAEEDGGDGGIITITNSIGINASSTPITANGGDSTSCGNGGDSGIISIINTTYGTITAEPGLGDNSGCSSSTKISGVRNTVTTVGDGHPSIPRSTPPSPSPTPSNTVTIGGGINRFFNQGLNGINFAPIQNFNLFGDDFNKTFKPIDVGLSRFPKVFTDLRALGSMLLDKMPVNLLPNLQKFILEPANPDKLTGLMPNASRLLAAVGVTRSQELASLMRSPKLITDIENPEKYGLFKVYSGDVLVNTYVTYEKAVDKLAQLIKSAPSQILYIGTTVAGNITDESKMPYIMYQGQKKILTPTFDKYYATSIVTPTLEGRYLIETSTDVQIILDVLPQNNSNEQSKPWGIFNKLWKIFH